MNKFIMDLNKYKGKYAVHISGENKSAFIEFLFSQGIEIENPEHTMWLYYDGYFLLDEMDFITNVMAEYGTKKWHDDLDIDCEKEHCYFDDYTVLEIDDFIVDVPVTREEIEKRIFEQAKYIFRLYKMYNLDGEYLKIVFSKKADNNSKFTVCANNDYNFGTKSDYDLPLDFNKDFTLEDLT